jgi:DNA polymerase-3 subunit epsilon
MHVHYGDCSKTLLQWQKRGMIVKDGEQGEELWTNGYCYQTAIYYTPDQVRPMTDDELAAFHESERAKKRAYYRRIKNMKQTVKEMVENNIDFDEILDRIYDYPQSVHDYAYKIQDEHDEKIDRMRAAEQEEWRKNNSDIIGSRDLIVLDTETTGVSSIDDLLQVSIIDGSGKTLINAYADPGYESWPDAEKINGITPEMVDDAPKIEEMIPEIKKILRSAKKIVGYNPRFDLGFLARSGATVLPDQKIIDVMDAFAEIYGDWDDYHGNCRWQTLSTCAAYYGYDWGDDTAHDSLADCKATLFCYKKILAGRNVLSAP